MATYKHLTDLLKICSVLPALAIMPAMAKTVDISDDTVIENQTNSDGSNQNAAGLTLSYGDKLSTNGANNVKFNNNSSVNSGGAMKALNGFVAGDGWTFTNNHSDKMSGGLYVKIPETYTGVDPENINRDVIFGKNTTFTGNSSKDLGGALGIETAHNVTIGDNAKFTSNTTETDGGAIAIWTDSTNGATSGTELTLGTSEFTGNTAADRGGAIANLNSDDNPTEFNNTVNIATSTFENNSAKNGGAIYNVGTMNVGGTFTTNTSTSQGGAIYNSGTLNIADGSVFDNNQSGTSDGSAVYGATGSVLSFGNDVTFKNNIGDGALFLSTNAQATIGDNAKFIDNIHGGRGLQYGAIYQGSGVALTIGKNAEFRGNKAANNGAAIATSTTGTLTIGDGARFVDNSSISEQNNQRKMGGALYIANYADFGTGFEFSNNTAAQGGAIYYHNKKEDAVLALDGHTFSNNHALGDEVKDIKGAGGALLVSDGVTGTVDIKNSTFEKNDSTVTGGAILQMDGSTATINIDGSTFAQNQTGAEGGAVVSDATLVVKNSTFTGNKTTGTLKIEDVEAGQPAYYADNGGGAIFLYDESNTTISGSTFTGNTSGTYGGAIATRIGADSAVSSLTLSNSVFESNHAGANGGAVYNTVKTTIGNGMSFTDNNAHNGGAIWNDRDAILSFVNTEQIKFEKNIAGNAGGAIYSAGVLEITNATFTGNSAAGAGGAIANVISGGGESKVTLSGTNTFANNTAAGVANDIYNDGTMTVASGTTTLGGGITGDGTLTIEDGATLNIGTTTVKQSEVTLDGTLTAQILNQGSYGRVETGKITVGDNGLLNLMFGSVGTYNFGVTVPEDKIVYNNAIYDATFGETGKITVATKSVEEIAQGTNLSMGAANAISIMANTKDDVLNTISLMAQQDLVAGKTGNAEKELAKLNPDDKPVAQSVASSVQNQVMSLAAGRMSGASVGRSGGDLTSADYGLWVQGLYNHSKYNGKFSGDTWGISVGADTLIDGKYTLGIGYAYNDTDVDSNSRDTGIESNSLFLYGQYKPNEWYVNAALNYTMANYDESADPYGFKRKTEYDVDSFGGQIMTGYDFASGFTPEVGMRYLHISQDAYQSWLGEVDALDTDYLTGVAGVKYAFEIESASELKFRPELRAAATYDFMSDAAVATVTAPGNVAYVIDADRLSRFGGEFGIGLTAQYRGLDVSLNYELDLHEDYTSQTGMLKFRYDF